MANFSETSTDTIFDLSLELDKPILLDYYNASKNKECKIIRDDKSQVLWKNSEEYTSPILRVLVIPGKDGKKSDTLVCETQNSLYVLNNNLLKN